ncbi:MAG: SURF1 family protein [Candidatus Nanopelagicales bacterium]
MLAILRQRRWVGFTVFILAMVVLTVFLARWQWNRYQVRLAENDRLDAALSAPAVPVDELLDAAPAGQAPPLPEDLHWRTVTATGTFDSSAEVAVRRRPLDGRNGFWIVTPLRTDTGVLLVNRGWTPADGAAATSAPVVPPAPAGTVSVTGRLRPAEVTEQAESAPPGQAWAADPDRLVTPAGTDLFGAYIELTDSAPPADAELTALSTPGHRGLNNLVYSVQWIIFGLVGLIGGWYLMRTESRREELDAQRVAAESGA